MTYPINIRCNFLKNVKLASSAALLSSLLAFSSQAFSQNLLTNSGFENGTTGWTLEEGATAQFTESGGRSGNRLTHWSDANSYRAETRQVVSGLTEGSYRFSVYTVGGETSGAWLWAWCDGQSYTSTIPSSPWGSWAQVTVDNIQVSGGGQCTLGITTEDSEWSSFDDVVFERTSTDGGTPPGDGEVFLPDYILGADWAWVQEHESIGWTYSDNGETKSLERILADHGFNYARFRLFLCPDCPDGYNSAGPEPGVLWSGASDSEAWHDVEHNIQMSKRAKACGMGIFTTFHLSDTWASIGHQNRPSEWEGMSLSQMRTASYNHTKDALDQMVAEGVKPDMVQCGNEVNTHVSGYSFNDWAGYSGIINSCAQAVRDTDPNILLVAHHGRPRPDGNFAQWIDRLFVDSDPAIEADVICGSTYGTTNNGGDWWDMFTYANNVTGKPVMSCEYTNTRRELVNNTFRSLPNSLGTFIWEPTAYGDSRPFTLEETSTGIVARTNPDMDEYARIAQEEGLPVPLTPASELEGTSCQ